MAGNGYSVDDILEEIRRKKEGGAPKTTESESMKNSSEPKGDFFEMRQKNTQPEEPKEPEAPTYTKKFRDEPITTRVIQVDDTLSQYFGASTWKNDKKSKKQKDESPYSKVTTVPAHENKAETKKEKIAEYVPKDFTIHDNEPISGFIKKAADEEKKPLAAEEKKVQEIKPEEKPSEPKKPTEEKTRETKFSDGAVVNGFGSAKTVKEKSDLTSSGNHDLYKEFIDKRNDKVAEFMKNVAEPTDQEIHIPEIPAPQPTKNRFSNQSNEDIAVKLMQDMHEPEDDDPDDYENISQKEAVEKNLSSQFAGLVIRSVIIFILFLGSLFLCLSPMLGYPLPDAFSFEKSGIVYPIINLAIVCIAALTCHVAVGGGLISLMRFRAGNDSFATCSVIGAAALGVAFIADPSAISPGGENLFFPIVILGLFFNTVGKILSAARIKNNFEVLTDGRDKAALLPVRNKELARELTGQRDETPRFCTSAKAKFFTRFLELSYRDDATESIARIVAPIVFLCSILVGGIAFLLTGRISDAITGFAAILCVASPFSATIAGALPVFRSCSALNEEGGMMAGGYTAETFAETDSVLLDIEQLFPEGSIILHGIKTFARGRIDEAILDAASVICSTRSTLGSIFVNVVQGDKKLLKPVDTIIYEDGMGLSAWVGGKRVLIGNRELMINHGIDIPSHDYENKYVGSGKDILYLANSGELTAMFVLSYHADKEVYRSLGIMAERGVRLVINCSDPNITTKKLSELFGYPENQLNLLSSKYQQKCAELTEERETAPAAAVYDGSLFALSDLLNCCGIIRQSSFAAALIEMIGIVLGFILVTIFLFTGNIRSLDMYILLGFQMFWLAAVSVIILLRKKI
ncbi:MAG: cation-translocating P-type ATPase [Oscillospiraceae bacterium]|nr:cation-translocating P-type ATPase [Oscillospiraceae bacterium]